MIYALFSVIILFAITLFIAAALKIDLETAQAQATDLRRRVDEQGRILSAISKIPSDAPCPHCGEHAAEDYDQRGRS